MWLPIIFYHMGKTFSSRTQTMIEENKIGPSQLTYWCLSKNFSITTENAANPAHPKHAAFGPPTTIQKHWKYQWMSLRNTRRESIFVKQVTLMASIPDLPVHYPAWLLFLFLFLHQFAFYLNSLQCTTFIQHRGNRWMKEREI